MNIYNKQVHAKIINKDIWFIYNILKAISIKISEHHKANPGFNSVPQWSRQAVSTYFSGSGQYLRLYGVATNQVVEV